MTKTYAPTLASDPRRDAFKQMLDTSRLIRTYIDTRARAIGTTRAQWSLLAHLARQPGLTQSELSDILEIQPISLTRLVDRMADQGLVVREPHPSDRRANCVFITENGLLAMEAFSPLAQEITEELFQGISADDVNVFQSVVNRMKLNVKECSMAQRETDGLEPAKAV
jgi:DNA-binding MarR family transcriptional regulator